MGLSMRAVGCDICPIQSTPSCATDASLALLLLRCGWRELLRLLRLLLLVAAVDDADATGAPSPSATAAASTAGSMPDSIAADADGDLRCRVLRVLVALLLPLPVTRPSRRACSISTAFRPRSCRGDTPDTSATLVAGAALVVWSASDAHTQLKRCCSQDQGVDGEGLCLQKQW